MTVPPTSPVWPGGSRRRASLPPELLSKSKSSQGSDIMAHRGNNLNNLDSLSSLNNRSSSGKGKGKGQGQGDTNTKDCGQSQMQSNTQPQRQRRRQTRASFTSIMTPWGRQMSSVHSLSSATADETFASSHASHGGHGGYSNDGSNSSITSCANSSANSGMISSLSGSLSTNPRRRSSTSIFLPRSSMSSQSLVMQSQWDQGLQVISSLLDHQSEPYKAMSEDQRQGLRVVQNLLLATASPSASTFSSFPSVHISPVLSQAPGQDSELSFADDDHSQEHPQEHPSSLAAAAAVAAASMSTSETQTDQGEGDSGDNNDLGHGHVVADPADAHDQASEATLDRHQSQQASHDQKDGQSTSATAATSTTKSASTSTPKSKSTSTSNRTTRTGGKPPTPSQMMHSTNLHTMHIPTQLLHHAQHKDCVASQFLVEEFGGASSRRSSFQLHMDQQQHANGSDANGNANGRSNGGNGNNGNEDEEGAKEHVSKTQIVKKRVQSMLVANKFVKHLALRSSMTRELKRMQRERIMIELVDQRNAFVPPEFLQLTKTQQQRVHRLLSWDSCSRWGDHQDHIDVFELDRLTGGNPLLFMGWAIMAAPHAQQAMQHIINGDLDDSFHTDLDSSSDLGNSTHTDTDNHTGNKRKESFYGFVKEFQIPPVILCNFLRCVQKEYATQDKIPYHNRVHAADVLQTVHCIFQSALDSGLLAFDRLSALSILIAAAVHDMGHPGFNNSYQIHARTKLAITYNDISVLENMHASRAFQMLFGNHSTDAATSAAALFSSRGSSKPQPQQDRTRAEILSSVNILMTMDQDQIASIRELVISGVLSTDMSKHFQSVSEMKSLLVRWQQQCQQQQQQQQSHQVNDRSNRTNESGHAGTGIMGDADANADGQEQQQQLQQMTDPVMIQSLLNYILHVADISNPAKPRELAIKWTDQCLQELFHQGDTERSQGLDPSPLCDRSTTSRPKSQIGFLQFVVQPAYQLLCRFLPRLQFEILPIVDDNIWYWQQEWEKEQPPKQKHLVTSDCDNTNDDDDDHDDDDDNDDGHDSDADESTQTHTSTHMDDSAADTTETTKGTDLSEAFDHSEASS